MHAPLASKPDRRQLGLHGSARSSLGIRTDEERPDAGAGLPLFLQTKPGVSRFGEPADSFEQEADTVAEQVMRMSAATAAIRAKSSGECSAGVPCAKCSGEKKPVQRMTEGGSDHAAAIPDSLLHDLGPGQPLDSVTRNFFEPRFGQDFSAVQVHSSASAAASAQRLNALAFTIGNHIVFGGAGYASQADSGRRLIAHELTHVVQQKGARSPAISRKVNVPAADRLLKDALAGQLEATPGLPVSTASFFYERETGYRVSHPAQATAWGDSPVDALLKTINRLHWEILKYLDKVPAKGTRNLPAPPPGEVKLAVDDVPTGPPSRIIDLTARDLQWNIEVLVPALGELRGRPAIARALEEKSPLTSLRLVTHKEVQPGKVKPRKLGGFGPPACIPVPAHRVRWKSTPGVGLHIDAGGTGDKIATGQYNKGYPNANNLNLASHEGSPLQEIPNLVCGNIFDTWPIADDRADLITVHSAPINPQEIARVIKRTGRILMEGPSVSGKFQQVLQELANRRKRVSQTDARGPNAAEGFEIILTETDEP